MEKLKKSYTQKKFKKGFSEKEILFEKEIKKVNIKNISEDSTFIMIFCPQYQICTLIKDYDQDEILALLSLFQKSNYLIIHINNDDNLYKLMLENKFTTSILSDLSKITDITIDYCFSPIDELLFFNFSLLETCDLSDYNKFTTQMYFVNNGLYIVNKKGFNHIFEIMMTKFHFDIVEEEFFFKSIDQEKKKEYKKKYLKKPNSAKNLTAKALLDEENFIVEEKLVFNKEKCFYTDKLIYWLLVLSLEKLEDFSTQVTLELSNLYELYMKLPLKERKAFYRRLHLAEVAIQIIHGETKMKKKFIKFILDHGGLYNKLTDNYFVQNNLDLLLDLIMSKITQLEFLFERYDCTIKKIKENFHIIIEDNAHQGVITFNNTMKLLTIISTLYAPLNIITGVLSMNVEVPFQINYYHKNFNVFFVVIFLVILINGVMLYLFKRNKWF